MLFHPEYSDLDWRKWRLTFEGGRCFIEEFMQKFSARELESDFLSRKAISYCPAFAKAAVEEIVNAIFQRMADVSRLGGSESYVAACLGRDGGIDFEGNSATAFMGQKVLPELLIMKKVGIFVDMPPIDGPTLADSQGKRPYIYAYKVEDILNWTIDPRTGLFSRLLLKDCYYEEDKDTGLPIRTETTRYRYLTLVPNGVLVRFVDDTWKDVEAPVVLTLPRIPFILAEIANSLLADVSDYQIALLNMASSDVNFAVRANFPIYTEQSDPRIDSPYLQQSPAGSKNPPNTTSGINTNQDPSLTANNEPEPGTRAATAQSKPVETNLGVGRGRKYGRGLERPDFIHPSPEPLKASMEKQEKMKLEIRALVHLSVSNQSQRMASADSKSYDERGLESGLSAIGLVLEKAERQIAELWAMYEKGALAVVTYPTSYSLETDAERILKAKSLSELIPTVSSPTYQKEIGKKIARTLLGNSLPISDIKKIEEEIDASLTVAVDVDALVAAIENEALSPETFGKIMGFPAGEAERAAKAHEEHLKRIAENTPQTGAIDGGPPSMQGDQSKSGKEGRDQKAASADKSTSADRKSKQRGDGK